MVFPETVFYEYPHGESDIYRIPVVVNKQSLMAKFYALTGDFVSYKDAGDVGQRLFLLFRLLESMQQRKPLEADGIAREMIELLIKLDTDDDYFPVPEISALYELLGEQKTYDEICDILHENR